LLIRQVAGLKRGDDVVDDAGNILYRNTDLTLPPRRSRSYAYCSDTAYVERIAEQVKGVDILYHEATFTMDDEPRARETLHSTAAQAATIALKADAGKLVLGHFSARYKELEPILDEARRIFPEAHLALEGVEFSIAE
jgi:ribonuclease Z